jgi:hypothetical protein
MGKQGASCHFGVPLWGLKSSFLGVALDCFVSYHAVKIEKNREKAIKMATIFRAVSLILNELRSQNQH